MKAAIKPFFSPVRRGRVFEEVSSQIKEQIYKGTLKPGDRLQSESELARSFDVSRQDHTGGTASSGTLRLYNNSEGSKRRTAS
jgi:GntR family transcriptional repressor for pyruvate dehydrogenase complex